MTAVAAAPATFYKNALERPQAPPSYFFLGGSRRSGTTWVTSTLNSHPEILIKSEGWLLNDAGGSLEQWLNREAFERWMSLPSSKVSWLKEIPPSDAVTLVQRAMAEALMREAAARAPWKNPDRLRLIGDKTTTFYCTKVDELHRLFPEARLIHMIRDGRDSVVSDMFLKFRYKDFGFFGDAAEDARRAYRFHVEREGDPVPLFTRATLTPFARYWRSCVEGRARARALYGDRFLELRYEALRQEPTEIAHVFEFLGVSADESIVRAAVEKNTFEKHSGGRKPGEENPVEWTRKGIVGDWRNHFTDEDRAVFKELAGETLIELGYEPDASW
ncbi:MAG: sulfotransferase [Phycisphaeraceae bacterium]|nr:sulfotransferase [Phycisphaeraceae bacterium]